MSILGGREWFGQPGASDAEIERLSRIAPRKLPLSYLELLRESNGGEGPLPVQPWNFCLDTVEFTIRGETEGWQKKFFPDFFVFAGNGGGEALAFDLRSPEHMPIVCYDMTNSDHDESVFVLAPSFDDLLPLIGVHQE